MGVPGFEDIDAIEAGYSERPAKPTLGESYALMLDRWLRGARERELALRLLFLCWYRCSEPTGFTGLDQAPCSRALLRELAETLDAENTTDAEVCFVLGIITEVMPYCLMEDEAYWAALAEHAQTVLLETGQSIHPGIFADRGAYGEYFEHQASYALTYEAESKDRRH